MRCPRSRRRKTERVPDGALRDLLVAHEPRQDRQAGGVGRRPRRRANAVRTQAPGRAGPCVPGSGRAREPAELVETAGVAVDEQRVMVASVFDMDALPDRIADAIALVRILERDLRPRRLARDDVERDPDRAPVPGAGAEICMEAGVEPDRANQRRGVRRHRQRVDAPVPRVRAWEDRAARRVGQAEGGGRAREAGDENDGGNDADGAHSACIGVTAAQP